MLCYRVWLRRIKKRRAKNKKSIEAQWKQNKNQFLEKAKHQIDLISFYDTKIKGIQLKNALQTLKTLYAQSNLLNLIYYQHVF